jgi:hypothetical protein
MDFKNNKIRPSLLKLSLDTITNLISCKNKLKDLYSTIEDDGDYKKKANAITFKIRNYIKWIKLLKSLEPSEFETNVSIKK